MPKNRTKNSPRPVVEEPYIKDFLDMVAPSVIDFKVDHYLCGNTCRCVWALREYPTSTDEQAILRHLGEMDGVTIRIYTRQVTPSEERRIIHNAANKHRMSRSSTEDLQQTVTAEANLQDVVTLVSSMHRNREPLLHCAVFLELTAPDYDTLKLLQTDVLTELVRSKLNVDRLTAKHLGISNGYLCDIEQGRRPAPEGAFVERISSFLELDKQEHEMLLDLAADSRQTVPADLPDYIRQHDIVRAALRVAKEVDATDEEWKAFMEMLQNRQN